ncbi:reverse transcriptase [Gossypium australe]|uniref:Reverse transcriptase n=1 Tax=Gossypium australe TaxID=47621 RepID=A0A5B6UZH0_9ROSI|nr:reverse transcriptase [Gossypium australe]
MNLEADREEIFLEQRARANWLQMGDRNTAFFHRWASYHRKKNMIKGLENVSGRWVTEANKISKIATGYFKDLFSSKEVRNSDNLIPAISPCITEELNKNLMKEFQAEEVVEVIKSIAPLKASSKDGFPAIFFQKYWHIVGNEVTRYCLNILNGRRDIEEVNHTSIVLIPKVISPNTMSHFRPISLCNVIYKIISKVIVNRFRQMLHHCIDDSQGAFIPGKQITDIIFMAYKILHWFKKRRGNSNRGFALKLDMSKAYDRIKRCFVERLMRRMGFCEEWTSFIMRCITSVSYTVVTNGKNREEFRPTRGLRQGDPLSLYLFLICAEGFSRLIELAKREGRLLGERVGRSHISITHLFFADDSVLFGEASTEGANIMKSIINEYEALSR